MHISKYWMAVLTAAITLTAMDAAAKDEVYRWVDDKGIVHFGDRPPEKTTAEAVELRETDSSGVKPPVEPVASVDASGEVEPSAAEQQRAERAERRRVEAERQAAIAAGCEQRRKIVAQLEPSTRVIVKDEDGNVFRLDDNERLKHLNEAKTYIAENCRD